MSGCDEHQYTPTHLLGLQGLELPVLLVVIDGCNDDDGNDSDHDGNSLNPIGVLVSAQRETKDKRDDRGNSEYDERGVRHGIPHELKEVLERSTWHAVGAEEVSASLQVRRIGCCKPMVDIREQARGETANTLEVSVECWDATATALCN